MDTNDSRRNGLDLISAVDLGDMASTVIIARPNGFWVCDGSRSRGVGQAITRSESNDPLVMRQMLAGCLVSARPKRSLNQAGVARGDIREYAFRLCGWYRTTHTTPRTLRRARDRFLASGDRRAADYAEQKAVEETGHDRLVLRDLAAMGLAGERLVATVRPPNALALVGVFADLAANEQPYGVFGYAYVLERMALWITREMIADVQRLAPPGTDITRCLRVHSAIGADAGHVAELVEFIAGLPKEARNQVCRAVHLVGTVLHEERDDQPARETLSALLDQWAWQPFPASPGPMAGSALS